MPKTKQPKAKKQFVEFVLVGENSGVLDRVKAAVEDKENISSLDIPLKWTLGVGDTIRIVKPGTVVEG